MSGFNGAGIFTLTGPEYPAVAATLIQSAYRNTLDSAIATGLSNAICKDGQSTPTANIPLGGFKLTGVGAATVRTDAATLATIQDATGVYVGTVGGTADAITLTPSPAITAYAAGQRFSFIASGANTGAVTVNVSTVGVKSITKSGAVALAAGDIQSGALVTISYDGTRFQLGTVVPMTAAAILSALLTVDGAGSTLDADFLDGISSASFAQLGSLANFTAGLQIGGLSAGYLEVVQLVQNGSASFALTDSGKSWYHSSATAHTWTIPANASVAFPVGSAISLVNDNGGGVVTVAITTDTLRLAGAGTTGSRSLAANGVATIYKATTTSWFIFGNGVT